MRVETAEWSTFVQPGTGWTTNNFDPETDVLGDDSTSTYVHHTATHTPEASFQLISDIVERASTDEGAHRFRYRTRYGIDIPVGSGGTPRLEHIGSASRNGITPGVSLGNVNVQNDQTTPTMSAGSWVLCPWPFYGPGTIGDPQGMLGALFVRLFQEDQPVIPISRVYDLYFDVDYRNRPTVSPYITQEPDGAAVTTVTVTNRPYLNYTYDLDGLPLLNYTLWLQGPGGLLIIDESGPQLPAGTDDDGPGIQLPPLSDGDYTYELRVSSRIGQNTPFASVAGQEGEFTVAFVPPPPPTLAVTEQDDPPRVRLVMGVDPSGTPWDDVTSLVGEIERLDPCQYDGWRTIHAEPINISNNEMSFVDRFMSLSDPTWPDCDDPDGVLCEVTYRVRWWGHVDEILVATDWTTSDPTTVDNPTSGNGWLRSPSSELLDMSVCAERSWGRVRPYGVTQPAQGGMQTVVTGSPGGRNHRLEITVEDTADLLRLEDLLENGMAFYQPADPRLPAAWVAPDGWDVAAATGTTVRSVSTTFTQVAPEPVVPVSDFIS